MALARRRAYVLYGLVSRKFLPLSLLNLRAQSLAEFLAQAGWAIWLPYRRHSVKSYKTRSKSSCLGYFLNRTLIAQEINLRVEMKPRSSHKTKRIGVNGQPAEWEEVLAKHTSSDKCVNKRVNVQAAYVF